jgi:hypothetical protein
MARVPNPAEQACAEIHVALNGEATRLLHTVSPERTIAGLAAQLEHARETVRLRGVEIEELVAERDTYMRRLALALEATKGWELLFEGAVRYSLSLRDRASLLESAVKTYASHVWNDIESMLSTTDV